MQVRKFLFTAVFVIAGAVLAFLFNFMVLDRILIPDPCYYHSHDTNLVFDLFYEITTAEGGHPSPTIFNLIFTIVAGGALGYALSRYMAKSGSKKQALAMQD